MSTYPVRSHMRFSIRRILTSAWIALVSLVAFNGRMALAQGCPPSRFTTPTLGSLGGSGGDIYLPGGVWQLGFAYRDVNSNELIVGHHPRNDLAPGGIGSFVHSQSMNISLVYGVTDRLSLTLNAPFSKGSVEAGYADGLRHTNSSAGLGEISVSTSYWLRNAQAFRPGGNVAIGFGVKAPTGKKDVQGTFWKADGTSVPFPVVPTIELGDGSWGVVLNAKAFQPVMERSYVYGGDAPKVRPKKTTNVMRSPVSTVPWSAPDSWDANIGVSTIGSTTLGLSVDLGAVAY